MEQCANCRRAIGELETPQVFHGNIVCPECRARLDHDLSRGGGRPGSLQPLFIVLTCAAVPFLVMANWFDNNSSEVSWSTKIHYQNAAVVTGAIGLILFIVGFFGFAIIRMRSR